MLAATHYPVLSEPRLRPIHCDSPGATTRRRVALLLTQFPALICH